MEPQKKATGILRQLLDEIGNTLAVHPGSSFEALIYQADKFLEYKKQISEPRNVLDHGFVRLVDYMGNDLSIVRAARVSYDADWRVGDETNPSDEKLIQYLIRNRHTSPFESVVFTFEIKCPIFIARQWHRHRTWSYNEVSARYTELPREYYLPKPEHIGVQSKDNKQARDMIHVQDIGPLDEIAASKYLIKDHCEEAFKIYKALLLRGVPRELARTVLPLSTYTRYFGTVNLHNLLHFLSLRLHPHAQYEIRVYAEAILDIISHIVPVTMDAWKSMRLEKSNAT
jgi:thymidylate synthase (FAD)